MSVSIPSSHLEPFRSATEGGADDPRLGSIVSFEAAPHEQSVLAIVGFPVDEGVRRNGGRPGAALAPSAIRDALYRMTPDARRPGVFSEVARRTVDLGNVKVGGTLADSQHRLGEIVAALLEGGVTPVIIGGGHETSFGHFLGYATSSRGVSILNFDAHTDVRPLVAEGGHSGSPFRQAIEHESGVCRKYMVAGVQPSRNARDHIDYVESHGGRILWRDDLERIPSLEGLFIPVGLNAELMLTMDLDVVDAAFAPGVSAPATRGISPDVVQMAAWIAGATPSVSSMDIVEVNPNFDVDNRTVRLAAHLIWSFMCGFATRIQ